jgi:trehalose synthase
VFETAILARSTSQLLRGLGDGEAERFAAVVAHASHLLRDRRLVHVNSTAEGGGVAELLRSNLGYLASSGIDVRWLVFEGDPPFFQITKRIHNRLHGDLGDLGPLGDDERAHYEAVSAGNLEQAIGFVRPGDVVVVHDPQPLGLVPGLVDRGAHVVWTCHVGADTTNDITRSAWEFLLPYAQRAAAHTFTRQAYVWEGLDPTRVALIPPCIDPLSLKNIDLTPDRCDTIMRLTGLADGAPEHEAVFERRDGTTERVVRRADMLELAPVPSGATIVTQVSRWDRLKDPVGVLRGFAGEPALAQAHLILAGPSPSSVADDPEAGSVLTELRDAWLSQPSHLRERIHIANLPTADVDENAIIVNALQRRSNVVVQKSLAEGFGLTVTEAMWKERPIVAGRIGGIVDQIEDGVQGLLVDPRDLPAFATAVASLCVDGQRADALGGAAKQRVRERFLPPQYLGAYLELITRTA